MFPNVGDTLGKHTGEVAAAVATRPAAQTSCERASLSQPALYLSNARLAAPYVGNLRLTGP